MVGSLINKLGPGGGELGRWALLVGRRCSTGLRDNEGSEATGGNRDGKGRGETQLV